MIQRMTKNGIEKAWILRYLKSNRNVNMSPKTLNPNMKIFMIIARTFLLIPVNAREINVTTKWIMFDVIKQFLTTAICLLKNSHSIGPRLNIKHLLQC